MNEYVRQAKAAPVLLTADDLVEFASLAWSAASPTAEPRYSRVWSNLQTVNISESTIDSYLMNPELPAVVTDLNISVKDGFTSEGDGREITIYLTESYISLKVAGNDQAWVIGTLAVLTDFFRQKRRRGGSLAQHRLALGFMASSLGGVLMTVITAGAVARQTNILVTGLIAAIVLLVLSIAVSRRPSLASHTLIQLQGSTGSFPWGIAISASAVVIALLTLAVEVIILVLTIRSSR